jgi:hypothetical protein
MNIVIKKEMCESCTSIEYYIQKIPMLKSLIHTSEIIYERMLA